MKLKNQTILITGGGRGIGLAFVEELYRDNKILITGRNEAVLGQAKEKFPEISTYVSDVADPSQIRALKEKVEKEHPALSVLINNAGVAQTVNLTKEVEDDFLFREIEINLKGVIRMVNAFLPLLNRQSESMIVNVSSGLAYLPFTSQPIYGAAKAGLHSYTLSLRTQLSKSPTKVVEVFPPVVETDMTTKITGFAKMSPEKHAKCVLAAINKGREEIRPGDSNFLYYASRIAPKFALSQLTRMTNP